LCYHAISSSWEHVLAVPVDALRMHVERLLRAGFTPVTAGETVNGSGNILHVTFDDAFKSVQLALPVLEELGVRATVFACSGHADRGTPLDVPELRAEVAQNPGELDTMDWDELRELSEREVEIGSHTVNHPHLTLVSDAALEHELVDSKHRIEEELGRPCRFLAYPYGDHDRRVREAARAAGYEAAFALPIGTRWGDRFQIGRVGVWRSDRPLRIGLKTSRFFRTELGTRLMRARVSRRKPTQAPT
jgi:peptidoglycan/xylan/chitin deacetylase (PgdA/CDA1 family)